MKNEREQRYNNLRKKISTWESLYDWVVNLAQKLIETNNCFSGVRHHTFDLKIAHLARVCLQLKTQFQQENINEVPAI